MVMEFDRWCDTCNGEHRCHQCDGEGVIEYEGDPLDDFIDADSSKMQFCPECKGSGDDERPANPDEPDDASEGQGRSP